MLTFVTAMTLAAAAQATPANAPIQQPMQMGQMQGMDTSQMSHAKMGNMAMGQKGEDCCKHGADGKLECNMHDHLGSASVHQGHSH